LILKPYKNQKCYHSSIFGHPQIYAYDSAALTMQPVIMP